MLRGYAAKGLVPDGSASRPHIYLFIRGRRAAGSGVGRCAMRPSRAPISPRWGWVRWRRRPGRMPSSRGAAAPQPFFTPAAGDRPRSVVASTSTPFSWSPDSTGLQPRRIEPPVRRRKAALPVIVLNKADVAAVPRDDGGGARGDPALRAIPSPACPTRPTFAQYLAAPTAPSSVLGVASQIVNRLIGPTGCARIRPRIGQPGPSQPSPRSLVLLPRSIAVDRRMRALQLWTGDTGSAAFSDSICWRLDAVSATAGTAGAPYAPSWRRWPRALWPGALEGTTTQDVRPPSRQLDHARLTRSGCQADAKALQKRSEIEEPWLTAPTTRRPHAPSAATLLRSPDSAASCTSPGKLPVLIGPRAGVLVMPEHFRAAERRMRQ